MRVTYKTCGDMIVENDMRGREGPKFFYFKVNISIKLVLLKLLNIVYFCLQGLDEGTMKMGCTLPESEKLGIRESTMPK